MLLRVLFFGLVFAASLYAERPFYLLTVPKAGTHLVRVALELSTNKKVVCVPKSFPLPGFTTMPFFLGIDPLKNPSPEAFELFMDRLDSGREYPAAHMNFADHFIHFSKTHHDYLPILMLRDPRDVIVSAAYFFSKQIESMFGPCSIKEKISLLLRHADMNQYVSLMGFEKYNCYAHMKKAYEVIQALGSKVHVIRYEELVGKKGGGSDEVQTRELNRLLTVLQCSIPVKSFQHLLYANPTSRTFHVGVIGEGKRLFTKEQSEYYHLHWGELHRALGYEE